MSLGFCTRPRSDRLLQKRRLLNKQKPSMPLKIQPSAVDTESALEDITESALEDKATEVVVPLSSAVRAPANPVSCRFWMIKADFIRTCPDKVLPFFQELREKHREALVEVIITYEEVVNGTHVEKILSISHRWMLPTHPDPDGVQLKAIKDFLDSSKGKQFELVWIDSGSMPQDQPRGTRTKEDTTDMKMMLSQVNMLYLGTTVLILLDLSYGSRFWTQFEAWLSMQFATPGGLKPAIGTQNVRHHIVCIQNAAAQAQTHIKLLTDQWADKTPQEAFEFLKKPDVTVTNMSDKEGQLPKIKMLNATVQAAFKAVDAQLQHRVKVSAGAGPHEATAAREAARLHAKAIKRGVRPIVMEREEAMEAEEAAKKRAAAEAKAAQERAWAEQGARFSQFQGPCKECCIPPAYCCVSSDGAEVYGCVPTENDYVLPLCLHMCLCPQQGCNPCPAHNGVTIGGCEKQVIISLGPTLCLYCSSRDEHSFCCSWEYICCCCFELCAPRNIITLLFCFFLAVIIMHVTLKQMCNQGRVETGRFETAWLCNEYAGWLSFFLLLAFACPYCCVRGYKGRDVCECGDE